MNVVTIKLELLQNSSERLGMPPRARVVRGFLVGYGGGGDCCLPFVSVGGGGGGGEGGEGGKGVGE